MNIIREFVETDVCADGSDRKIVMAFMDFFFLFFFYSSLKLSVQTCYSGQFPSLSRKNNYVVI